MRHRPQHPTASRPLEAGFTLVELVVVMLLLTVLVGVGASRFASTDVFVAQQVADRLAGGLRTAQAVAIAQRQVLHVRVTASPPTLEICRDSGCTQAVAPVSADDAWLPSAQGLSLDQGASFRYQPDGSTTLATGLTVRVMGSGASSAPSVRIEPSGLVVRP
jgi:prepilin-type N-terminal cleavage/methylation domain-containing protein